MPIYGFECDACGHQFDRLQKMSDPDPSACPECGAPKVKRQLTAPSFRLSGSGWYETDFKKDGDKKRNLTGSADGSGDRNGDRSGDAPKPEAKPDAAPAGKAAEAASAKPANSKPGDSKPAV
jgi:putative FmdB family regulatory protein